MEELEDLFQIEIQTLGYEGGGFGRLPDGRALSFPSSCGRAGDSAPARGEKRFRAGRLVSVTSRTPQRTAPRCAHFGACGGCIISTSLMKCNWNTRGNLQGTASGLGGIFSPQVKRTSPRPKADYRNALQFPVPEDGRSVLPTRRKRPFPRARMPPAQQAIKNLWPQMQFEPGSLPAG